MIGLLQMYKGPRAKPSERSEANEACAGQRHKCQTLLPASVAPKGAVNQALLVVRLSSVSYRSFNDCQLCKVQTNRALGTPVWSVSLCF